MYVSDASGFSGNADAVFTPRDEEEIAQILARASREGVPVTVMGALTGLAGGAVPQGGWAISMSNFRRLDVHPGCARAGAGVLLRDVQADRKSTRLNSSHLVISYAVFCLKKKNLCNVYSSLVCSTAMSMSAISSARLFSSFTSSMLLCLPSHTPASFQSYTVSSDILCASA